MTRRSTPRSLSELIPDLIDDLGVADRLQGVGVVEAWRHVAGESITRVAGRARFADGKLTVEVHSAAWRQVLHLQRDAWRDRVNEQLGSTTVREIVFR